MKILKYFYKLDKEASVFSAKYGSLYDLYGLIINGVLYWTLLVLFENLHLFKGLVRGFNTNKIKHEVE